MSCCDKMEYFLGQIREEIIDSDEILYYCPQFDEYGITVHDSDSRSYIKIDYCPFCGRKLPDSKRALWFKILEEQGLDVIDYSELPRKYFTDKWWKDYLYTEK